MEELRNIQSRLNAPKNQQNKFGGYSYRSAEDILEAVKPLLKEYDCILTLSDDVVVAGNRYYIRATATITNNGGKSISVTAMAREAETKKGMDEAQITGASSSYARKYALNGLLAIDDNKDADDLSRIASASSTGDLVRIFNESKTRNGGVVSDRVMDALTEKKNELKKQ